MCGGISSGDKRNLQKLIELIAHELGQVVHMHICNARVHR